MSDDASSTGSPTASGSPDCPRAVGVDDYAEALRLLPPGLRTILPELGMCARWVDDSTCWWWTVDDGRVHYWSLSAQEPSPTALFSHSTSDPHVDEILEIHPASVRASVGHGIVHIDRRSGHATPDASAPPTARAAGLDADVPGVLPPSRVPSPDGRWIAERSGWDIVVRSAASNDVQLSTRTGTPERPFGDLRGTVWSGDVSWRRAHGDWPPQVSWSANSRWLITTHTDLSSVTELPLLDSAGVGGAPPSVESFLCPLPGGKHPTVRIVVLDIEHGQVVDPGLPTMSAISPILQQGRAWNDPPPRASRTSGAASRPRCRRSPPIAAGWMLSRTDFGCPLIIGGTLKAVYDLLLLGMFRGTPPPEERRPHDRAGIDATTIWRRER